LPDASSLYATARVVGQSLSVALAGTIFAALGGASAGRALILATADTASADNKAGCLVLDTPLPGLSGLDLQRELAATDAELPIILLTGHGDIPMSARAMKAGAVEFLTKPFREQDLLDAIRHAIERDQTMRAERQQRTELRRPARPSVRASAAWWPGSLAVWPTRTLPASSAPPKRPSKSSVDT
jgi:DNA-binding NtrC family response regulator